MIGRFTLAACVAVLLAGGETPLQTVQARLARGDTRGAEAAMSGLEAPPSEQAAERAWWLDAAARIAWGRGEMDRSFALSLEALAVAERAGVTLPPLTGALTPERAWLDAEFRLPLHTLPTGDAGAQTSELAKRLLALPEARKPDGAWLVWGARLLDRSVPAPAATPKPARESAAQSLARRRCALLQAACEARFGDARAGAAVLRAAERPAGEAEGFARWFQAEALAREGERSDGHLASLRWVQSAAAFQDSPWLRVAALRRAADVLQSIDPAEAARLLDAADKETP